MSGTAVWLVAPLLLSGGFGVMGPRLSRRLPPQIATWLLSGGALVSAAASSAALALAAVPLLGRQPVAAATGRWSAGVLARHGPLAAPVGVAATVVVAVFAVRFVRASVRRVVALRDAHRLARALPGPSELAVLDRGDRQAFAVPGRPGRIVATTAMLRVLDAGQRRALLAHEHAHLAHRHHLHQAVAALAVSVNPLLARLPAAVELACERWADEDAAGVSQRSTLAAALARAATGGRIGAPAGLLAAGGADVAARLAALRTPPPRLALWRLAVLGTLLGAAMVAVAVAMHDTERLFELAQNAYRLRPG